MDQHYLDFTILTPRQTTTLPVFCFVARKDDIQQFARIERASRSNDGVLSGFQRPQIANHIKEIRRYLESTNAILPNPIVVAFTDGVGIHSNGNGTGRVRIDISQGPRGWIVDGQQRYSALQQLEGKEFEVLVSAFLCDQDEELHKQFILINNTKPLPKSLIYELLPNVSDLPDRYTSRSTAALLVEMLNYQEESCLNGLIKQQTNPEGVITDTAIQKVIINSLNDGALRLLYNDQDFKKSAFKLLNNFFKAVIHAFPEAWHGHKPSTSRLVHGAGIMSLGYVMETLFTISGARSAEEFAAGLKSLVGQTAWTSGVWNFGPDDQRKWNSIQNIPRDIRQLSEHLVALVKQEQRLSLSL